MNKKICYYLLLSLVTTLFQSINGGNRPVILLVNIDVIGFAMNTNINDLQIKVIFNDQDIKRSVKDIIKKDKTFVFEIDSFDTTQTNILTIELHSIKHYNKKRPMTFDDITLKEKKEFKHHIYLDTLEISVTTQVKPLNPTMINIKNAIKKNDIEKAKLLLEVFANNNQKISPIELGYLNPKHLAPPIRFSYKK